MLTVIKNILFTLLPIFLSLPVLDYQYGDVIFVCINIISLLRKLYGNKNGVIDLLLGVIIQLVVLYKVLNMQQHMICTINWLSRIFGLISYRLFIKMRPTLIIILMALTEIVSAFEDFFIKTFSNF